ncbi:DUF721 domain-containing protein [Aquimarina brevivitae]|uniref:Uncharacterized protein DUF721 n=1 Tax=Aquimarina brevivitae TaxID=323412 RepID=A0A4Q7P0E8_9FLAO|nr:DUF721 domain-containing protein [Aquimarina brevivitae]RZS93261.1 uncharacterized protein DUF721 [Aquimarina brevivitae]
MAKRSNDHQSLSEVLKELMEGSKLQTGLDKVAVRDAWQQVMGKAINNYTQEVLLRNETLYISLTSSVLREELSYGKDKIIINLNETLGKELIKKLVLR